LTSTFIAVVEVCEIMYRGGAPVLRKVHTSVDINASAAIVWAVLTDVEAMPQWTKSMSHVRRGESQELAVGSTAAITQPRLGTRGWTVVECTPLRSFTWVVSRPGITTAGIHQLEPTSEGVRVTLTIEHRGPLAAVVALLTSSTTRRYIRMEGAGLKRQSEKV
jgi:uncharacterized membrane protein